MPSIDEITVQQLSRLIGLPEAPRLVDLRHNAPCDASNDDVRLFALGLSRIHARNRGRLGGTTR